jgi:hypothetical protein
MMAQSFQPETAMTILRAPLRLASALPLRWAWLAPLLLAGAPAAWAETVTGNGQAASDVRHTGEFNAIGLGGSMALKLKQGSTTSVVVHGDSNLLPLIETVVERDRSLQLRWKRGVSVRSQAPVYVEVVAPQVQAVASAGSGDVDIDAMKVPRLSLAIKGSGGLRARGLATDDLAISVSGSGDLKLAGQATHLAIQISGSGGIDAGELRSDEVTVGITGSGHAVVHASRMLVASIAGSGGIRYSGEPSVQQSIAGSGKVSKR